MDATTGVLYTVEKAGRLLGIKPSLTYELVRTGAVISVRVNR